MNKLDEIRQISVNIKDMTVKLSLINERYLLVADKLITQIKELEEIRENLIDEL